MKVIKPQSLSLLTRPFEFKRRFYLGASTLAFIPLREQPALLPEVAMWPFLAKQLGDNVAIEAGIPKRWAEFLVTGSAYTPNAEPQKTCLVRARIGSLEKILHIFGDRHWQGMSFTQPQPFTTMPLDWAHAYGGEGFNKNPLGKGYITVDSETDNRPLPNIETPRQPITSISQRPDPAGFGALDLAWPQRTELAGTHDQTWLKQDFPGFARDIDWHFFNLAYPDQHFPDIPQGDEAYLLENMHPEKTHISGQLPGVRCRCFINHETADGLQFSEIKQRLMTLWFFPEAEHAVLIYQGFAPIAEEDAADVQHIIIGAEWLRQEKPAEHYQTVLEQRLDKDKGILLALRDSDLLPAGIDAQDPELEKQKVMSSGEGLQRQYQQVGMEQEIDRRRDEVAGYDLDPNEHGPVHAQYEEPPTDMAQLPEYFAKLEQQAEQQKAEAEAWRQQEDEKLHKSFKEMGRDYADIEAERKETPRGPPTFKANDEQHILKKLRQESVEQGIDTEDIDGLLNDEERQKRHQDAEKNLHSMYQQNAHRQDPAYQQNDEHSKQLRAAILQAYEQGESLAQRDFTGADLSGLKLPNIDLRGAYLESAAMDKMDLTGAQLQGCVMAHASLRDSTLDGAQLQHANLGKADLSRSRLQRANLDDAILSKAILTDTQCQGASLNRADLMEAVFANTDFSAVTAEGLSFIECDLRGLILRAVKLPKCNFLKVNVSHVDFSGANLESAVFVGAQGQHCDFSHAHLQNMRLVQECDFSHSDFSFSQLKQANLRGTALTQSKFTEAQLDGADLSECALANSNFYRAIARAARFVKADLKHANLTAANLLGSMLSRADLRAATLKGSNLYEADMARIQADRSTDFSDTLNIKVRTLPLRVKASAKTAEGTQP